MPPAKPTLRDYLPDGFVTVNLGAEEEEKNNPPSYRPPRGFFSHDFLPRAARHPQEKRRDLFLDHLRDWLAEKWEVAFCNNEGEHRRAEEIL